MTKAESEISKELAFGVELISERDDRPKMIEDGSDDVDGSFVTPPETSNS